MIWSLDFDDFSGKACGKGKFPLISFVKSQLDNGSSDDADYEMPKKSKSRFSTAKPPNKFTLSKSPFEKESLDDADYDMPMKSKSSSSTHKPPNKFTLSKSKPNRFEDEFNF